MKDAKIIIVEDESIVAADLEDRLTRLGYTIVGVRDNGSEALRMVQNRPVDLVLMDIVILGDVDGIQTASQLRDRFRVPVVFLTSHTDLRTIERAGPTTPYGYISKPFDEGELHATLEMAFYRKKEDDRMRQIGDWLTQVLLNIGQPIVVANQRGRLLFLNPAAEALLGWSFAEAEGRPCSEVIRMVGRHPGGRSPDPLYEAFANGSAVHSSEDAILLTRHDSRIDVDYSATPLSDDRDELIGSVLVVCNVAERKAHEEALLESNRRFRQINQELLALLNSARRGAHNLTDDD